jgi:hypothetical protein
VIHVVGAKKDLHRSRAVTYEEAFSRIAHLRRIGKEKLEKNPQVLNDYTPLSLTPTPLESPKDMGGEMSGSGGAGWFGWGKKKEREEAEEELEERERRECDVEVVEVSSLDDDGKFFHIEREIQ